MKILIVTQHYPPDLGAVSFRFEGLVHELVHRHHDVYVLTAQPNRYTDYEVPTYDYEGYQIKTLQINTRYASTFQRVKGFLAFYVKVLREAKTYRDKAIDVVVSTTPYLLEGLAGQKLARKLKAKHLLDVRDLWPDTAIALGKISSFGPTAMFLRSMEKTLYKKAHRITVTSPGYIDHIQKKATTPIAVVYNGIDESLFKSTHQYQDSSSIHIVYAGNIGVAQNLITLVRAAQHLDSSHYHISLVGSGSQLKDIKTFIKKQGLTNVSLHPPIAREHMVALYEAADILFLQLFNSPYFYKVIPSKIFEYLVTDKPIVYGLDGVSKTILQQYPRTYSFKPDDVNDLIRAIQQVDLQHVKRDCASLYRKTQSQNFVKVIEEI